MMEQFPRTARAQCLCGRVSLEADLPSLWAAHCHCTLCRRAHGAAFVTWVGMEEARCRVHDAGGNLQWYASSAEGERGFCRHCGCMMLFRGTRWPGELHVAMAHFTTPVDRMPQVHVYWDEHVPWAAVDPGDGLPRKP
ncbi:GFA family protein [Pseudoxanthomonas putridarboris]|uniref:GFA family protein n=1 Tax=Pseudoxanthomonas putridarboris TaxID=752605 RepID=A0ABU9IW26_9GAMM